MNTTKIDNQKIIELLDEWAGDHAAYNESLASMTRRHIDELSQNGAAPFASDRKAKLSVSIDTSSKEYAGPNPYIHVNDYSRTVSYRPELARRIADEQRKFEERGRERDEKFQKRLDALTSGSLKVLDPESLADMLRRLV